MVQNARYLHFNAIPKYSGGKYKVCKTSENTILIKFLKVKTRNYKPHYWKKKLMADPVILTATAACCKTVSQHRGQIMFLHQNTSNLSGLHRLR